MKLFKTNYNNLKDKVKAIFEVITCGPIKRHFKFTSRPIKSGTF